MARKETGVVVVHNSHKGYTQVTSGWTAPTMSNGMVYIPLPTTNTIYTDSVYIGDCNQRFLGIGVMLTGNVAVNTSCSAIVTVEGGWSVPVVEGSFAPNYLALQTVNMVAASISWNYQALQSGAINAVLPYVRCKVATVTTHTSGTINIVIMKQVSG